MEGLNLHNVVGDALAQLNPWQTLTFIKTVTEWKKADRTPTKTTETVVLQGKMQPASLQVIVSLGFNVEEFQYFRCYLSADITQIDRLRQLGADYFTDEHGDAYKLVAKEDWIQNGWREGYCYLDNVGGKNG